MPGPFCYQLPDKHPIIIVSGAVGALREDGFFVPGVTAADCSPRSTVRHHLKPLRVIHLRLFGTVGLYDEAGNGREEMLAQQKRAGLLAYLAVGRPRGMLSRESLTGMFWPELTDKRARSALNQALYYLRNAVGDDAIHSRAGEHVRLAPSEVECDVVSFEDHLDKGELKQAVALYRGPFLDGFFLTGLAAFERWVESERARLADRAKRAMWQLADAAAARGDAEEAIEYTRQALELSHDEASVRKLIEIRDRFGDRVGAIREYDRFARQVARELEAEPSPETQHLVQQIRDRTASAATPQIAHRAVTVLSDRSLAVPVASVAPVHKTKAALPPRASWMRRLYARRSLQLASVLLPAMLLTLWMSNLAIGRKPNVSRLPAVAVLPFSFTGDASRASATDAVAGLLDAQINAAGRMRTVDWRRLAESRPSGDEVLSPETAATIAERHDADLFIVGTVNEAVGRYRITGSLYSTFDPSSPQVVAIVQCDSNSLFEAVDTLAVRLMSPKRAGSSPPPKIETVIRLGSPGP